MTEQQYTDAANLAKLRTACTILHDCLALRDEEKDRQRKIQRALREWIDPLEKLVSIDPDETP